MKLAPRPFVPGQRFCQFDGCDREQVVTVVRLDRDPMGLSRVVFQAPGGREICAYASQIEAAIAAGHLAPADDRAAIALFAMEPDAKLAS
jgi:hypothetical protein